MKEEALYQPVKRFLEEKGYTVHGEVKYCDVAAVKDDDLIVVELKKNLSVELLTQGVLRQKLTPNVYVAVPKWKKLKKGDSLKDILYLLRRLELGLLLVDVEKDMVEVAVEPKPFDLEKSRKRMQGKRSALLTECNMRTLDCNVGGSRGKKLVTAYREQAIGVACVLKVYGPQTPKEIRAHGGDAKKTYSILRDNYYGWFEKCEDGKYFLTEAGFADIDVYSALTGPLMEQLLAQEAAEQEQENGKK